MLMHYENITFIYHDEFNKYMKVEWTTLEGIFDCLFDIRVEIFFMGNKEISTQYIWEMGSGTSWTWWRF